MGLELRRFTENTVGSIQELHTQLMRVRKDGFALRPGGTRRAAYPLHCGARSDHTGAVNASLSVTGPAVRMSTNRLREIAAAGARCRNKNIAGAWVSGGEVPSTCRGAGTGAESAKRASRFAPKDRAK